MIFVVKNYLCVVVLLWMLYKTCDDIICNCN